MKYLVLLREQWAKSCLGHPHLDCVRSLVESADERYKKVNGHSAGKEE